MKAILRLIMTFIVFSCLFAAPPSAHADVLCDILNEISKYDENFPSCDQLTAASETISCVAKGGNVADCVKDYGGEELSKNPYFGTFIDLYIAVDNEDYIGVVGIVLEFIGDDAPCIIADIMFPGVGGSLCGLMKELIQIAQEIGEAVVAFFNDLADLIGAIACFFTDCDTQALWQTCFDEKYKGQICNGAAASGTGALKALIDDRTTLANETYNCLFNNNLISAVCINASTTSSPQKNCYIGGSAAPQYSYDPGKCSHRYDENAVITARSAYESAVDDAWTVWIRGAIIPRLETERFKYMQSEDRYVAAADNYIKKLGDIKETTVQFCLDDFTSENGYEATKANEANKAAFDACTQPFAPYFDPLSYSPTFRQIDLWRNFSKYPNAKSAVLSNADWCSTVYYKGIEEKFKIFVYDRLRMKAAQYCPQKEAGKDLVCNKIENYKQCYETMSPIGRQDICGIDLPKMQDDICNQIWGKFQANASDYKPHPANTCNRTKEAVRYVSERPTHLGFCKQFYKEVFTDVLTGGVKLPAGIGDSNGDILQCDVEPTSEYMTLADKVKVAVQKLNEALSEDFFKGPPLGNSQSPPHDYLVVIPALQITMEEIKQKMGNTPCFQDVCFDFTTTAPTHIDGVNTPTIVKDISSVLKDYQKDKAMTTVKPDDKLKQMLGSGKVSDEMKERITNPKINPVTGLDEVPATPGTKIPTSPVKVIPPTIDAPVIPTPTPKLSETQKVMGGKTSKKALTSSAPVTKSVGDKTTSASDLIQLNPQPEPPSPVIASKSAGVAVASGPVPPPTIPTGSATPSMPSKIAPIAQTQPQSVAPQTGQQASSTIMTSTVKPLPPSGTAASSGQIVKSPSLATQIPAITLPDITAVDQLKIGTQSGKWGGSVTVDAGQAVSKNKNNSGLCEFMIEYGVRNTGKGTTGGFQTKLTNSSTNGNWQRTWNALAAETAKTEKDIVQFQTGGNTLRFLLDDQKQLQESDEANNAFQITVNVTGNCGAAIQTPPQITPQTAPIVPVPAKPSAPTTPIQKPKVR